MLWLTRTTLNIQSFMGAIMAIGVAVANAILLVTFAERSRVEGRELWEAAIEGARSRLRPILMTSFADAGRDDADGAGPGRGRRAKCSAGARGDRRSPRRNLRHAHHPAGDLGHAAVAHASVSASLDPDDPDSRYFEPEPRLGSVSDGGDDAPNSMLGRRNSGTARRKRRTQCILRVERA